MRKTMRQDTVVRERITQALFDLMALRHIDDITVTQITSRAEVARVSFYRNFDGKDDVLRAYARRQTERFLEGMDPTLRVRDPHAYVVLLLEHMRGQRGLVELLMASQRLDVVREEFDRAFDVDCDDAGESLRRGFLSGGLFNLFLVWARHGYEPDARHVADYASGMLVGE